MRTYRIDKFYEYNMLVLIEDKMVKKVFFDELTPFCDKADFDKEIFDWMNKEGMNNAT